MEITCSTVENCDLETLPTLKRADFREEYTASIFTVEKRNSKLLRNVGINIYKKGKAVPLQAQRVLRKLRFPDFVTTAHRMVAGCQHYVPAAFTPGNTPGTHFC